MLVYGIERGGGVVRLDLVGEADFSSRHELQAAIAEALALHPEKLVIDVGGLSYLDSRAVSALLGARSAALACGTHFVLINPAGRVLRILHTLGVYSILTGHST